VNEDEEDTPPARSAPARPAVPGGYQVERARAEVAAFALLEAGELPQVVADRTGLSLEQVHQLDLVRVREQRGPAARRPRRASRPPGGHRAGQRRIDPPSPTDDDPAV
jgi:hypothetical protein